MPKYYPYYTDEELPTKIDNDGERRMYAAFRQLPDNWEIFHSHRYHRRLSGGRLEEREIDFIILIPDEGVLFMEVKGSYGFERIDGKWYRIDPNGRRHETRDPFEQVSSAKHSCIKKLKHLFTNGEFRGKYGQVVAYPNGKYAATAPSPFNKETELAAFDVDTVLQAKHLHNLEDFLTKAIRLWGEDKAVFNAADLNKISKYLNQNHGFIRVAASDIDEDEQDIEYLTNQQYSTLRKIQSENPNIAIVKGEAGSGKTLIAKWVCETYASLGKRILFVCYNKNLAAWVGKHFDTEQYNNVDAIHFHGLCKEAARLRETSFNVPNGNIEEERFWQETAPEILLDAINDGQIAKYDVVVVDEGQDFNYFWWTCVTDLVDGYESGAGMLHIFYDFNQTLYQDRGGSISHFFENKDPACLSLDKNCRNTKYIVKYCSSAIEREIKSFTLSPAGYSPVILDHIDNAGHRRNTLKKQVNELLSEGIAPSKIAILSPYSSSNANCSYAGLENINSVPLTSNAEEENSNDTQLQRAMNRLSEWYENKRIWASTVKSFKGLEADCVILTDVPDYNPNSSFFGIDDLYVALTRAKHRLIILPATEGAHEKLKDWLV